MQPEQVMQHTPSSGNEELPALPRHPDNAWRIWLALATVLALAAVLRLPGLSRQSLWNDEIAGICLTADGTAADLIARVSRQDAHPPAYALLLHYVQRWAGNSETAVRMPSAVAGVLAVLAIFLVGRELASPREGLVAALLLTTAWFPIYYSQEARPYMILMLATLTATLAWLRLQGIPDRRPTTHRGWWTALYFVASAASCYLHYFGLQFVALQGIAAVCLNWRSRRRLVRTLVLYGAIAALFALWLPAMWHQVHRGAGWIPRPDVTFLFEYLTELCNRSTLIAWPVAALLLFLLALTVRDLARKNQGTDVDLFLWTWFLAPYALAHVQSAVLSPVLVPRYLAASAPAFYLLVVRSVYRLPLGETGRTALGGLLGAVLLFHVSFVMHYTTGAHKEQFREAVAEVIRRDPDYHAPVIGCAPNIEYFNYYFKRFGSPKRVVLHGGRPEDIAPLDAYLDREHPAYVWWLVAHEASSTEFTSYLASRFASVARVQLFWADVLLLIATDRPALLPDRPE